MINDLEVILSEGEGYMIEFKESADKSLPSEVCAFANASGGRVFIGIDDSGNIKGTEVSNAARSRIQDTINQIEPRLIVDIEIQDNFIVVIVPEGTQKPYSCSKGFYLRSGSNSQKLERDSIIEFFQSEGRVRYDEIIRQDLPLTEQFNEEAYRRYIKLAKISDVLEKDAILRNLNCVGAVNGKLYYTNVGALFFRKNDDEVIFRHAGIVCALYKGTDKAYILDAKELNGDIVSNVDDAIVFLKKHLRISYKIEELQRENILELPEDALREAEPKISEAKPKTSEAEPKASEAGSKASEAEPKTSEAESKANERKKMLKAYMDQNIEVTSSDIAKLLGLSKSRARAILKEMTKDGEISKVGENSATYYMIKK